MAAKKQLTKDRESYVSSGKEAVEHLINTLSKKTSKSKDEVVSKKKAFMYAKDIIIDIYELDYADNPMKVDEQWYKKSLTNLIKAGREAKNILEEILRSPIEDKTQKNDIEAKAESHAYVSELLDGIGELEDKLKEYDREGDFNLRKKQDFESGFPEKYAE